MELAGYVAVIRRWWATLLIAAWVAGLAGYLIASGVPPTYEGITRLLVGPVVGNTETVRAAGANSYTYAELATSVPALDAARTELGLPADLEVVARAIPDETTRVLEIRAERGTPEDAAAIANFLATHLIETRATGVVLPEGQLTVIEPATPNPIPIAPQVTLIAIIAAGTGLLAAIVLVLLVEYFSNTINSPRELAEVTRVPLLGHASLGRRFRPTRQVPTIVEAQPHSRSASAVRLLATKIAYAAPADVTHSMLVVGCALQDGTADLALGVGTALARAGRRVVVVDANDEAGDLSHLAGVDRDPGLADALEQPDLDLTALAFDRPLGPSVIGRGRRSKVDLVDPDAARQVMNKLAATWEIVIVTAAPIHLSGNALVWSSVAQGVVLAVERDRAKRDDVAYAMDNLNASKATILGTILLDRAPRRRRGGGDQGAQPSEPPAGRRPGVSNRPVRQPGTTRTTTVPDPSRARPSDELGH